MANAETKPKETKAPKMVTVRLPLTRLEKEAVYVGVNGKGYLIKRGVDVEVPESVAEVLRHREEMLDVAMAYEAEASANAEAEE
jgi:hypothetical protein